MYLNDNLNQMDPTNVYRPFHLTAGIYIFFSSTHETFFRFDHDRSQNMT